MKTSMILLATVGALVLLVAAYSFLSSGTGTIENDSSFLTENPAEGDSANITIGYCPTMQVLAESIRLSDSRVRIEMYSSTEQVLENLRSGAIDIALVGRAARDSESAGANELRIGSGYTLVGSSKRFIDESELNNMEIHTALPENVVNSFVPEVKNIVYHGSLQEAISSGMGSAVLISWDDYDDSYELVIPINDEGKVPKFRAPVMYSLEHSADEMSSISANASRLLIKSFTSDKDTYGSEEDMKLVVAISSTSEIKNATVRVTGIKPYRTAYIDSSREVLINAGDNEIEFNERTPYCTSGCGGVFPGPYEIRAEVLSEGKMLAESAITINLTGGH